MYPAKPQFACQGRLLPYRSVTGEQPAGDLTVPTCSGAGHAAGGAVLTLEDGRVVIAGGRRINVYDPVAGSTVMLRKPVLQRRSFVTATVVGPRAVLVAGGYDDAIVPTSAATLVSVPR